MLHQKKIIVIKFHSTSAAVCCMYWALIPLNTLQLSNTCDKWWERLIRLRAFRVQVTAQPVFCQRFYHYQRRTNAHKLSSIHINAQVCIYLLPLSASVATSSTTWINYAYPLHRVRVGECWDSRQTADHTNCGPHDRLPQQWDSERMPSSVTVHTYICMCKCKYINTFEVVGITCILQSCTRKWSHVWIWIQYLIILFIIIKSQWLGKYFSNSSRLLFE